ncbi:uncharacterized protein LODBEIA_P50490 [Lodderomyces beijingensis]|uniref:DASH complex subunit SPC34 n=1 Tax=Lodderomyces beijingensis TaxID=1775926 RepID=A0ABP0ZRP0_9ASCO
MSLVEQLGRLEDSTKNLNSYNFANPGMFTNTRVDTPPIELILKDAQDDEKHLYKVVNSKTNLDEPEVERIDGQRSYIEADQLEESIYENARYDNYSQFEDYETPIARVPTILSPTNPRNTQVSLNLDNVDNPIERVERLIAIVAKHPNLIEDADEINMKLVESQRAIGDLMAEINAMENEIEEYKSVLRNDYNVAVSPVKRGAELKFEDADDDASDQLIDLDASIRREEEEIARLEHQMNLWNASSSFGV